MRAFVAEKRPDILALFAISMITAKLASLSRISVTLLGMVPAPSRAGFQREPLSPLSLESIPKKSGFAKDGSWAKIVLSLVPPVVPSATSKRIVISEQLKPALT